MTIACGQCGYRNPAGLRVCAGCAAPLVNLCPSCCFENPAGFKFCGSCGASLLASDLSRDARASALSRLQSHIPGDLVEKILRVSKQIEGDRRNVTIFFTDVVGFTSLSEKLDPEQVYTIIEQVQQAFLAEIYKYEGWFDKFLGDGLMAIFGAPVAHEDDAVRAVHAALGMQNALKRVNGELDPRLGITLRMRIGLNAGTVVVATMGSDMKFNYTPLGDAVNVASRLQSIAEPGAIVLSRAVYDQVKPLFDFNELGAIQVRGRVEPVEIFQVLGPKQLPDRLRGLPGFHTPMVGREEEFEQLQLALTGWMQARDRRLALVTGEAGIGKSRLTAELKQRLIPDGAHVLESASAAYGQSAYGLFVELLRALLQIPPDDENPHRHIRAVIPEILGDAASPADVAPYVEYLLFSTMRDDEQAGSIRYLEPAQLRQQIFLAVRDLLAAGARRAPLMLILEDLHWIDNLSLELLSFLINATEQSPIFYYCTSRPEGQSPSVTRLERIGLSLTEPAYLRIDLYPLAPLESENLLDQLLNTSNLPDTLKQTIHQRSEGNPFYLEETIRMLVEGGVLRRADGGWEVAPHQQDLSAFEVPRTLQGLIMARVDKLPEEPRNLLQCAAVIGRSFPKRLLQAVLETGDETFEADLRTLCNHELVAPIEKFAEPEYSFCHVLVQETVYASLLHRRCQRLHHKVAESIERIYGERLDDYVEPLAFHYQESRDHERAMPYLIRAAERAASRYANDEAMRYYQTVVELIPTIPTTPAQRIKVYRGLGDVQHVVGRYDDALQSFRNAMEIARGFTGASAREIANLASKVSRVHMRKSNYDESLRWLETALDELDRDPDSLRSVERMRVYHEMGWVYYQRGELDKAYQWRIRSLEIGAGTDYYAELGAAYNGLVPLFAARGDWDRAHAYAMEGLRMRERIGDSEGTARCYVNLANIAVSQGDWNKAIEHYERGLALTLRVGQASTTFTIYHNMGELYALKGDSVTAREYLKQALGVAERSGNVHQLCAALNNMAEVALLDGDPGEAMNTLERSLARAAETGNKSDLAQAYWLLSLAYLARRTTDDEGRAEELARQALKIATDAGLRKYEGRISRALGSILCVQGRLDEAKPLFERALEIFQKLKDRVEIARTQLELARWHQLRGDVRTMQESAKQALDVFSALGADADRRRALELLETLRVSETLGVL